MGGRTSGAVGAVLALLALAFATAPATSATPTGSRLAVVKWGPPLAQEELFTIDPLGESPDRIRRFSDLRLADLNRLSWSGDGTALAIESDARGPGVLVVSSDGSGLRPVRGTEEGFNPVFSPDGRSIAFGRYRVSRQAGGRRYISSASIWIVDAGGGRPRQLTQWQDGHFLVPWSFSPDGARLAAVHEKKSATEIVSVSLAEGATTTVADHGIEPAYSPDGSEIVFVRLKHRKDHPLLRTLFAAHGGDLFVAAADGSSLRRLTFTPKRREVGPSWDPSGQRLAYTQAPSKLSLKALVGIGSSVMEINADGSCRHRLLFTYGLSYRTAAWQPGPGRGAGRIAC
jgi:Tol biopolymer transport system component